jgi:alpha-tubulin suppressor-like RCC1 family protein
MKPIITCLFATLLPLSAASPLGSIDNPAVSAKVLKDSDPSATSGVYWFDTDGSGGTAPFQAYADMNFDGGGWTLIINSLAGDAAATTNPVVATGTVGLATAYTAPAIALARNAQIRHTIVVGGSVFNAYYSGDYYGTLPTAGAWTRMFNHNNDSLFSYHFGRQWVPEGGVASLTGEGWYYNTTGSPVAAIPVSLPELGGVYANGPLAFSGGVVQADSYAVWVREYQVVPEPSAVLLIGLSGIPLLLLRRRHGNPDQSEHDGIVVSRFRRERGLSRIFLGSSPIGFAAPAYGKSPVDLSRSPQLTRDRIVPRPMKRMKRSTVSCHTPGLTHASWMFGQWWRKNGPDRMGVRTAGLGFAMLRLIQAIFGIGFVHGEDWVFSGYQYAPPPAEIAVINHFTAISAGDAHAVGLKSDGTVVAWGDNANGQTMVPAGLTGVTAVSAGNAHTVALKSDGTVVAWGDNFYGQTAVPTGLTGVAAVAAGGAHTVALKNDGTVVAWGSNFEGETTVPAGLSGVTAIAARWTHTVALKIDGTVVAWGSNGYGETTVPAGLTGVTAIGAGQYHTVVLKSDGSVVAWGNNTSGQTTVPAGLTGVTAVAAGYYHTVALKTDGTVVAWGSDGYSQTTVPTGLTGVAAIGAGLGYTMALKSDGTTVAWGYGPSTVPAGVTGVTAIAPGSQHTMALKSDGTVVAWGNNTSGQTTVPAGLTGVTAISAGNLSSVALKSDGTVVAWGGNFYGQTTVPAGLTGFTAIAAGDLHTVALKSDGTVVAWGYSSGGVTTVPAGLTGVTAIAAGYAHTVALRNDGTVMAWGDNGYGQSTVPAGLAGVTAIAAGSAHTAALKNDGTVVAWGNNYNGETTVPTGLTGVTAIAAGLGYTVALKDDGTVVGWGNVSSSQTTVPGGLTGVIAIAAGPSAGATYYRFEAGPLDSLNVGYADGESLDPGGVDFGTVGQGGYRLRQLRLRNDGTEPLFISAVTVSGADGTDFQAIPAFWAFPDPYELAPGAQNDIEVRFQPGAMVDGTRGAVLSIMLVGSGPGREIPLLGNVQGAAHPQPVFRYRNPGDEVWTTLADGESVDFGNVAVGDMASLEFVIENLPAADADLPIQSSFSFSQENGVVRTPDGFSNFPGYTGVAGYNPGAIAPGGSFGFTLVFVPDRLGPMGASHIFQVPDENGILENFTTNLIGTGAAADLTVVFPDGQPYESGLGFADFGTVAINGVGTRTFVLRNDGNADLFIGGLSFSASGLGKTDALGYQFGEGLENPLGPGETMSLTITYSPVAQTSLDGVLCELASNDPEDPAFVIHLQGSSAPAGDIVDQVIAESGLTGSDAEPSAMPFGDGVPNLLKYAFNMNLAGPDSSTLVPGASSGLPVTTLDESGTEPVLRVEFVRRKGSGLIYTAQHSTGLDSFEPMTGTTTVTSIDDEWEQVVVEEPCDPAVTPRCFSRVAVEIR